MRIFKSGGIAMKFLDAFVSGLRISFFLCLAVAGLMFAGPFAAIFRPTCVCEYTVEAPLCMTMLMLADFFFSGLLVVAGLFGLYRTLRPASAALNTRYLGWGVIVLFGIGLGVSLGYFLNRLDRFM
jgi:hypothetical protein